MTKNDYFDYQQYYLDTLTEIYNHRRFFKSAIIFRLVLMLFIASFFMLFCYLYSEHYLEYLAIYFSFYIAGIYFLFNNELFIYLWDFIREEDNIETLFARIDEEHLPDSVAKIDKFKMCSLVVIDNLRLLNNFQREQYRASWKALIRVYSVLVLGVCIIPFYISDLAANGINVVFLFSIVFSILSVLAFLLSLSIANLSTMVFSLVEIKYYLGMASVSKE